MAEDKYNLKNPAVKRILQEVKEMQSNPSDDFTSLPLEENIFEWQFAIRGPRDSEFEGGIYHGRIQLPAEYPFKPPSFMLLTPNGRFETQTKICLSISNHHPEHWQPSWSVRTALVALIASCPPTPNGALGSLDYKKEERRALAIKSRNFGVLLMKLLMAQIHEYMLSRPPCPSTQPFTGLGRATTNSDGEAQANQQDSATIVAGNGLPNPVGGVEEEPLVLANANPGTAEMGVRAAREILAREPSNQPLQRPEMRVQKSADDRLFTWAAIGLTIAIFCVLLFKKIMNPADWCCVF
ncbi:hypothetical protein CXB51_025325 [Gossypium anomalum]|uniref:UBC core domain-containing protein n=1 Tax=Gossypium anomalum TaxID=47600 RepID=A0A8J6CMX1_9ROSI|nr:hypothetical protein CXB51_025325 [Gossypium anomalum]